VPVTATRRRRQPSPLTGHPSNFSGAAGHYHHPRAKAHAGPPFASKTRSRFTVRNHPRRRKPPAPLEATRRKRDKFVKLFPRRPGAAISSVEAAGAGGGTAFLGGGNNALGKFALAAESPHGTAFRAIPIAGVSSTTARSILRTSPWWDSNRHRAGSPAAGSGDAVERHPAATTVQVPADRAVPDDLACGSSCAICSHEHW